MWTSTYTTVTRAVTKEQLWKLFADVNNWHTWDEGIEYARMDGNFAKGNQFLLRPKGGPDVKITLVETEENRAFTDLTRFPLAKMYGQHVFEETPDGLKMTTTMTVTGPLAFLWVKLVAKKIANGLPSDMEAQIKAAQKL